MLISYGEKNDHHFKWVDKMKPTNKKEKALRDNIDSMRGSGSKTVTAIYNLWNLVRVAGSKLPFINTLTPFFGTAFRLTYAINQLFSFLFNATTKIGNLITRGVRSVFHLINAGVAIAKLITSNIPGPVAILTDITDLMDSIWSVGLSAKSFLFGKWNTHANNIKIKKTERAHLESTNANPDDIHAKKSEIVELENKIINKKAKLASRIEGLVINSVFLAGSVMLAFFPPLGMVGFGLLAAAGIYSLLNKFNLNPFKRIGAAIFGNPFKNKSVETAETAKEKPSVFKRAANWLFGKKNLVEENEVDAVNTIPATEETNINNTNAKVTLLTRANSNETLHVMETTAKGATNEAANSPNISVTATQQTFFNQETSNKEEPTKEQEPTPTHTP